MKRPVDPAAGASPGERVELRISKACRRRCVFCCEARGMRSGVKFMPIREAAGLMRAFKIKGAKHITFIGGEPTIHPHFREIARLAKLMDYAVLLTTDGTGLAAPEFAGSVLPYIDELCLSIHWHDKKQARLITNTDFAFGDAEAAFGNIRRFSRLKTFMCHSVFNRLNAPHFPKIIDYVLSLGKPDAFMVSQMIPWGRGLSAYNKLVMPMRALASVLPQIKESLDAAGCRMLVSGLPLCVLGKYAEYSNDLRYSPRLVAQRGRSWGAEDVMLLKKMDAPPLNRVKSGTCALCGASASCCGVFKEYLRLYGDSELSPMRDAGR